MLNNNTDKMFMYFPICFSTLLVVINHYSKHNSLKFNILIGFDMKGCRNRTNLGNAILGKQ